jgi:hypothetical protein
MQASIGVNVRRPSRAFLRFVVSRREGMVLDVVGGQAADIDAP